MKNKYFKILSHKKKESNLMHILRAKTDDLLKSNEEAAILSAASRRKQFEILVFNDINSFRNSIGFTDNFTGEVIYGEMAMKEMAQQDALVATGIAVLTRSEDCIHRSVERLLIYIPAVRKCNGECVREKYICEHMDHYDVTSYCCDLQRVTV